MHCLLDVVGPRITWIIFNILLLILLNFYFTLLLLQFSSVFPCWQCNVYAAHHSASVSVCISKYKAALFCIQCVVGDMQCRPEQNGDVL